ncbi:hypothetical protein RhiJN_06581 [Ceratobasidium sp. AG-Ba]|nr:hypothetical protein RhiJN_06581 [Ceratobasidium sp. AG-Ba]
MASNGISRSTSNEELQRTVSVPRLTISTVIGPESASISFSHLISVVLVARMTLHLRSEGTKQSRTPHTSSIGAQPVPIHICPRNGASSNIHSDGSAAGKDFAADIEMGRVNYPRAGKLATQAPQAPCNKTLAD